MRVTRLKITNLRAIEAAEFKFQPGFNLIVGVNGVGKTSVLDALGICLSAVVRHSNGLRTKARAFLDGDIRIGAGALTVECSLRLGDRDYGYLIHKSRTSGEGRAARAGMPREQALATPDKAEFIHGAPPRTAPGDLGGHALGVLFSIRRALVSDANPSKASAAGGIGAACADAFSHRELRLSDFALWMHAQEELSKETGAQRRVLDAFESAVQRVLPGYRNIRTNDEEPPRLLIDRGERTAITVDELTDAERARLREATVWADNWMALNWKADEGLKDSELQAAHSKARASTLADALSRFLPSCENLRPDGSADGVDLIDRKPMTLDVVQLSDGERGTLALVLDLTRRLAQANPEMADPATEAEAVVLIDEIELHLHPKWQRQIIRNLIATFPHCQFIVTTHSPQLIGEVEHDRIQIIANGQIYSPTHSYGVDSSRVLEEIMDTDPRAEEIKALLSQLSQEVGRQRFEQARVLLARLVERLGEDDPEVTRVRTLLDFMEGAE